MEPAVNARIKLVGMLAITYDVVCSLYSLWTSNTLWNNYGSAELTNISYLGLLCCKCVVILAIGIWFASSAMAYHIPYFGDDSSYSDKSGIENIRFYAGISLIASIILMITSSSLAGLFSTVIFRTVHLFILMFYISEIERAGNDRREYDKRHSSSWTKEEWKWEDHIGTLVTLARWTIKSVEFFAKLWFEIFLALFGVRDSNENN